MRGLAVLAAVLMASAAIGQTLPAPSLPLAPSNVISVIQPGPGGGYTAASMTNVAGLLLPHVANNTALSALSSTSYPVVVRDGFALAGDAPALEYTHTNAACTITGGDGGSQVPTSDGKCWVATIPASGMSVAEWGALGAGDDTTTLQAAINASYGRILNLGPQHLISASLNLVKPIILNGVGSGRMSSAPYGTRIYTTTPGITLLNIDTTGSGSNDEVGGVVSNVALDGNNQASIGLTVQGIDTVKWTFNQISAIYNTHLGAYLVANHSMHFYGCNFDYNGSYTATDAGVEIVGLQASQFYGCDSETNHGQGVIVAGGYANLWSGGTIEGNYFDGFHGQGTANLFTITDVDIEANGLQAAATYSDINITGSTQSYWRISNNLHFGTTVLYAINNLGTQTTIEGEQLASARYIHWDTSATTGVLSANLNTDLDATSVVKGSVQAINTGAKGFTGFTTPAVPASGASASNPLGGNIDVYIISPGTVTGFVLSDGFGNSNSLATPLGAGQLIRLMPGGSITLTYSVAPTWVWAQR